MAVDGSRLSVPTLAVIVTVNLIIVTRTAYVKRLMRA